MLGVFLAGVGFLIDRDQSHETHETAHAMPPTLVLVALHEARHLTGSLPWRFQELLVDDFHEPQVFRTLALRLIVQIGP